MSFLNHLWLSLFALSASVQAGGVQPIIDAKKTNEARRLEVLVVLWAAEQEKNNPGQPNFFLEEMQKSRGAAFDLPYSRKDGDYEWWRLDSAFAEGYCFAGSAEEKEYCPTFQRLKAIINLPHK